MERLINVREVESKKTPVIGVSSPAGADKYPDDEFEITATGRLEQLVANVYFQLFTYHVADDLCGRSTSPATCPGAPP